MKGAVPAKRPFQIQLCEILLFQTKRIEKKELLRVGIAEPKNRVI